jgi:hypothetical protein
MTIKLTLSVEKEIIELSKEYAKKSGRSLSDLIENYLKTLVVSSRHQDEKLGPITTKLSGIIKGSQKF